MTEGEEFIADFLRSENIKFQTQKSINFLEGDSKNHRVADFYLSKYKIYIEFNGLWNIEEHKDRYREKKHIYQKNGIPCVYLYPENLGIIEYIFHKRLVIVLKEHKLKKELLKYRCIEIWKRCSENFLFLSLGILILYLAYPWGSENNSSELILGIGIILYQVFKISRQVIQIVKFGPKNKRIYI